MPSDLLFTHVSNLMELARTPPSPHDTPDDEWAEHLELRALVHQIRELQREAGCARANTGSDDFEELRTWLMQCGATLGPVTPSNDVPQGNGLVATEPLSKGDVIAKIPELCMMTPATARRTPLGSFLETDKLVSLMDNVTLALHLMIEMQDRDSFWAAYIQTLPTTFSTPINWEPWEIMNLKGSPAFVEVLRLYKHVARQYCYFFVKFAEPGFGDNVGVDIEQFTFDDYLWAVSAVMTRQNKIPVRDEEGNVKWTICLVPFWDLMNHKALPMSSQYNVETDALESLAPVDVATGDQVFMCYGSRNNGDYVLHQGFFYDDHPDDYMTFPLALDEKDPLMKIKALLMKNLSVPSSGDFTVSRDATLDPVLVAFMRISVLEKDELETLLRNPAQCATLGDQSQPFSRNSEFKSLLKLKTVFQDRLAAYPDEDFAAKASETEVHHEQCAFKLLASEKQFLMHSNDIVQSLLASLKQSS
eukprot:m.6507 g.6507  ORF g.6507 m.6507 type:complete len:475 (+) comp5162_c0_seq1:61-1485(+)